MITREEAKFVRIRCPDDKHRFDKFVDRIYDSRGSCETCKYWDQIFKSCQSFRNSYNEQECGAYYTEPDWFCGDHKPKEIR
jgi:hypothetical protein